MITSLIISAIRFDFRQFGSTLLGVMMWGLFWSGGATIAVLLLKASDDAARWLAGQPDANGETELTRAGQGVRRLGRLRHRRDAHRRRCTPAYNPGSVTAILICLLLIVAIVDRLWSRLLMRNVALLLIILLLPLTLAGRRRAEADPGVVHRGDADVRRAVAGEAVDRDRVAARRGAGVGAGRKANRRPSFVDAMLGVTIILLAGLLPGVIYRFSGGLMNTAAGGAPRAGGRVQRRSRRSRSSRAWT